MRQYSGLRQANGQLCFGASDSKDTPLKDEFIEWLRRALSGGQTPTQTWRATAPDDVLMSYVSWCDRSIPIRPRQARMAPTFDVRVLDEAQRERLQKLCDLSESGGDLNPYLSPQVDEPPKGPRQQKRSDAGQPRYKIDWDPAQVDFALVGYDAHHFHLVPKNPSGKRNGNSDTLVFARVSRSELKFIHAGNHSSFHEADLTTAAEHDALEAGREIRGISGLSRAGGSTPELVRNGVNRIAEVEGQFVCLPPVSSAGTSVDVGRYCDLVMETIGEVTLDHLVSWLSKNEEIRCLAARRNHLRWRFVWNDLVVMDEEQNYAASVLNWKR